ncbi:Transcriptional repressor SdpR [compost metagenome]
MNESITYKNLSLFREMLPVFTVLNDENRQEIIFFLAEKGDNGMSVSAITDKMNLSRPAVSHHLKLLKQSGIVSIRKEGVTDFYILTLKKTVDQMKELIHMLEANCQLK